MRTIAIFLILVSILIGPSLARGQSLQEIIDRAEEKTKSERTENQEPAHVRARQVPDSEGMRIKYQVSPRAMEAGVPQTMVVIGFEDLSGDFQRSGFGFFAAPNGFILSASNAVDFTGSPIVTTNEGQRYAGEVVDEDPEAGIVLLKVNTDQHFLPLGSPEDLGTASQLFVALPTVGEQIAPSAYSVVPCSAAADEYIGDATDYRSDKYLIDVEEEGSFAGIPILNVYGEVSGLYLGKEVEVEQGEEFSTGLAVSVESAQRLLQFNAVY